MSTHNFLLIKILSSDYFAWLIVCRYFANILKINLKLELLYSLERRNE